jgi:acid phosphatase
MKLSAVFVLAFCCSLVGCGGSGKSAPAQSAISESPETEEVPRAHHVVVVFEENHSFEDVFVAHQMPWLESMALRNAYAAQYFANSHFSLPNYFWLTTGQAVTFQDNTRKKFNVDNITRYLNQAGVTWKEYAESLPSAGYVGFNIKPYVERHDPFAYFADVANSAQRMSIVPFTQFQADLATNSLPQLSFVTPNIWNDAHNGTLAQADTWLQVNIAPLLATPAFQPGGDGVLIVLFDESHDRDCRPNPVCGQEPGNTGGGRVPLVVIGPQVKQGYVSNATYMEQDALRTILDLVGVPSGPGASATATPMQDLFQ